MAWQKLQGFREKVEKNHTCVFWSTPGDLKAQVILGLTSAIKRHPAQGWVRAGALSSEEASKEILELRRVIDRQREELERLSLTPPEGAERLAQGKDLFTINFKVILTKERAAWGDDDRIRRISQSCEVNWDDIFGAFAPNLLNPTRETQMKADIARVAREKAEDELVRENPGYIPTSSSISESVFQTVKIQFLALGLIASHIETRIIDRTEKAVRVWELTNLGKRYLVAIKAIHRN